MYDELFSSAGCGGKTTEKKGRCPVKKIVSLFLAFCLVVLMVPALAEAGDVTGDWYGSMYGMPITLTLNADGTYLLTIQGTDQQMPGKYELKDGIVYMDGSDDPADGFVFDGSSLVNETQGVTLTRDAETAPAVELAEVDPEAPLEAFAGEWTCKYLSMMNMVMDIDKVPLEQIGANGLPAIKIEGENVEISGLDSLASSASSLTFKYDSGALVLNLPESLAGSGLEDMLKFQMLKDGMLAMTVSMGDQSMMFCFVPAAAEEAPAA